MVAKKSPRILIADDHPVFREALRLCLLKLVPQADVAEADSFGALEQIARKGASLALLDLMMPGADGFSALLFLRRTHPDMRVAIVSGIERPLCMRSALALGAVAYIPKSLSPQRIQEALRIVLDGNNWVPPAVAQEDTDVAEQQLARRLDALSPQELRVLLTLGDGRMNKQIAGLLGISEGTVKVHMKAILRKLEVATRTQAALVARELLLSDSERFAGS